MNRRTQVIIDVLLSLLALTPVLYFAIGSAVSLGLGGADDACIACAARYLAQGYGYASPGDGTLSHAGLIPFGPGASTGPTVVIPIALLFKILGVSELIAMVAFMALYLILFFAIIYCLKKQRPDAYLFPFAIAFSYFVLCFFGYHFEQWRSPLGEVPAALLTFLSITILTTRCFNMSTVFWAGVVFGLAVSTKLLAIFAGGGLFAAFILARRNHLSWSNLKENFSHLLLLCLGVLLPTILFELSKLITLGVTGYASNWCDYVAFIREQGTPPLQLSIFERLGQRFTLLDERYGLSYCKLTGFCTFFAAVALKVKDTKFRSLMVSNGVAILSVLAYWFVLSNGFPRYAVIGIVLLIVELAVMTALIWSRSGLWMLLALGCLTAPGLRKMSYVSEACDHGLFNESTSLSESRTVTRLLREEAQERPIALVSQWWAPFIRLKFSVGPNIDTYRLDAIPPDINKELIFVAELRYLVGKEQDAKVAAVLNSSGRVLFSGKHFLAIVMNKSMRN